MKYCLLNIFKIKFSSPAFHRWQYSATCARPHGYMYESGKFYSLICIERLNVSSENNDKDVFLTCVAQWHTSTRRTWIYWPICAMCSSSLVQVTFSAYSKQPIRTNSICNLQNVCSVTKGQTGCCLRPFLIYASIRLILQHAILSLKCLSLEMHLTWDLTISFLPQRGAVQHKRSIWGSPQMMATALIHLILNIRAGPTPGQSLTLPTGNFWKVLEKPSGGGSCTWDL